MESKRRRTRGPTRPVRVRLEEALDQHLLRRLKDPAEPNAELSAALLDVIRRRVSDARAGALQRSNPREAAEELARVAEERGIDWKGKRRTDGDPPNPLRPAHGWGVEEG